MFNDIILGLSIKKVQIQLWGRGAFQVYDFQTPHQKVEVQFRGGGGGLFSGYIENHITK